MVAIVFAANSSWVIKKVADRFAPEYKISYDDISGNVFTGVNINGLKFDDQTLAKNIKFSWNPSKILYKRVAINEINIEALDVDVVKALIASFPSDDNSSSEPFPFVVLVDKVHISADPFEEQGILVSKMFLDVEDVEYANDKMGIGHIMLKTDTNMVNFLLEASLDDGKLEINKLLMENVDTVFLETMFLAKEGSSTKKETSNTTQNDNKEPLNPLIPTEVKLDEFVASVQPRAYKSAKIEKAEIKLSGLHADITKIMSNSKNSITIGNLSFIFDSNVANMDAAGNMSKDTVTLENINLKNVDTLVLQTLFAPDSNVSDDNNSHETVAVVEDNNTKEEDKSNNLIPRYIVVKKFHTDLLPAAYDPVHILKLVLDAKDIKFNISTRVAENGEINLDAATNLAHFKHNGKVKDNHLLGSITMTPNNELFELYKLPVRKESIGDIKIDLNASKEQVIAEVKAKAKHILMIQNDDLNKTDTNAGKEFNVDIDDLLSNIVYSIKKNTLNADTKIMITTPYAKDISITNKFIMDKNMSYSGEINAKELMGIDAKFTKPLQNFKVSYSGDLKSFKTDIASDGLKGSFNSVDLKKGHLHIETTETIEVDKMVTLPGELNGTKVNAVIDVPLDFEKIIPIKAKAKITSNISNIDADITYGETLQVEVTSNIPADSLLKNLDKNVKWNAINPLFINADLGKKDVTLKLKSKELSSDIKYVLDSGKVDGSISLAGLVADVTGIAEEKITINAKVNSMKSLASSVQSFYTLEDLPPIEGALNLSVDVMKLKQADLSLSSPKIIYHADRGTEYVANDVNLVVSADKSKIQLTSYAVTYDEMKFFSTKPSLINIKEENIEISELWLNDQFKVAGTYNTKTKKGNISADASTLQLAHKMIGLDSAIDITTVLDGEKTSVQGKIILLGGEIYYDLGAKTYPSDSDIIIVQDMKKEKASPFMDNLSMLINVTTKKPLIYKKGPIDIQAKVDLGIHKAEHDQLMVLGEVVILKGGSYTFEGKKFILDKSNIYFTGNPNKPLLDMRVKYKSLNHLITIAISGTPATPNIIFSSVPALNKEQILSIILFDSQEGAGTNSGEDMMKMMGGAMAKSALSDMGIKLDHLAIGSGGSVEVGKKLTDKITFIYVNDEVPQVRVKYQHSSRWESVISADEESESYDIVYKRDFSKDDIMILGK